MRAPVCVTSRDCPHNLSTRVCNVSRLPPQPLDTPQPVRGFISRLTCEHATLKFHHTSAELRPRPNHLIMLNHPSPSSHLFTSPHQAHGRTAAPRANQLILLVISHHQIHPTCPHPTHRGRLAGAQLRHALLTGSDMNHADLTDANLEEVRPITSSYLVIPHHHHTSPTPTWARCTRAAAELTRALGRPSGIHGEGVGGGGRARALPHEEWPSYEEWAS